MIKNKFIKSAVSVLLCTSIVFAGSFVSQIFKVSADTNSKTFDFENTQIENGMANSAFGISADQNHGAVAGKSLKIEKSSAKLNDIHGMLLTTKGKATGEQYKVEWGKTYKITLWYKTVGTAPSESWMLGVRTGSVDFSGGTAFQTVDNPLMLPTAATDWTKYESTFTVNGSGEKNYLGLSVYFPKFDASSGYAVYIDDVTVEQTDSTVAQSNTRTFDFGLIDDNLSSYANSAFSGSYEEHHGDAANGKSIKIYKDSIASAGKMGSMLTLKNKGKNFVYNVEWGKTYKVTLWYKTVGTASFDPWKLKMYTNDFDAYSNTSKLTEQAMNTELSLPTTATEWTKFEATFTAAQPNSSLTAHTALGIGVEFPAFSGNTDYKVYIDDIKIEETGAPVSTTKTFDFEKSSIGTNFGTANSAFTTTSEAWHGTAASGKSLRVYKDAMASAGSMKALLTTLGKDNGEKYDVEWGKTYKVTLWYKTVGNAPGGEAWSLGFYTCLPSNNVYSGPSQSLHTPVSFQTTESSDWIKVETTFTAAYDVASNSNKTSLGLYVDFPSFSGNTDYKVYIDDVTVEETDPPVIPPSTSKTFDFEGTRLDGGSANTAFTISNEAWHGTASSGKSMKIYKNEVTNPGYMKALLTTGNQTAGERYNVEWGKTYKVTLWYKTVGTAVSTAWALGICTGGNTDFSGGKYTNQTLSNRLYFPTTETDWTKFETTFTATQSNSAYLERTYVGISVNFPSFTGNTDYKIYIDDVTVEETEPPIVVPTTQKLFDFESTVLDGGTANTAFTITGEQFHGDAAGGKSLQVYKDKITSAGQMKVLLTTGNQTGGERYNVEWGKTYKVTLWYKTVGTAPSEAWTLGVCTGGNTDFSGKVTNQIVNTPLYFQTTPTNGWIKHETTFTATENNSANQERTYLGLSVYFPVFSNNTNYKVYIDDVVVEETEPPVVPPESTTKTFDFETTVFDLGIANTAFTISGEQHHGSAAYGKSLKIYKDSIATAGKMGAMLTTGTQSTGERYNVEWGTTYKVTLWYKTVGTAPSDTPWKLQMYTNNVEAFSNTARLTEQSMNNSLSLPKTATDGWVKHEALFTALQTNNDYRDHTCLGIGVEFPKFEGNSDYMVYIDDVTLEVVPDDQVPEKIIKQGFENYNYLGYGYYYDRNFEIYNSSINGFDPKNVAEGSNSIHATGKVKSKGLFSIMTDNYYIMDSMGYYKLSFMVRADSVGTEGGTIKALPLAVQSYTRTADEDFATNLVDMNEIKDGRWYKVTQIVYAASYYYLGIQTPGDCSIYIDDIEMRKVDPSTVVDLNERVVAMSAKDGVLDNGNGSYPRTGERFPYVIVEIGIVSAAVLLVSAKSLKRRKSK